MPIPYHLQSDVHAESATMAMKLLLVQTALKETLITSPSLERSWNSGTCHGTMDFRLLRLFVAIRFALSLPPTTKCTQQKCKTRSNRTLRQQFKTIWNPTNGCESKTKEVSKLLDELGTMALANIASNALADECISVMAIPASWKTIIGLRL